jgi:folate-binding protein YgfZ
MENLTEEITFHSVDTAYAAAHDTAVLIDRSNLGLLKFSGKSRLDLINRMSTQDVVNLKDGEGAATVLTTEIGRIIDRIILYEDGSDAYCLTSENNGDAVATYLRRFVFYMDDFHIDDLRADSTTLAIYGRQARSLLTNFIGEQIDLPLHHWRLFDFEGKYITLYRTDPIAGDGYFLMSQQANKQLLLKRLIESGMTPADDSAFEYLRIESGRPRFAHELTDGYIPLEANLWADVSFKKGCYTGQEIIARMESRGRIAKRMVLLKGDGPAAVGLDLMAGGKKAGTLTSIAAGPRGYLALGFVKSSILADGSTAGQQPTITAGQATFEISTIY